MLSTSGIALQKQARGAAPAAALYGICANRPKPHHLLCGYGAFEANRKPKIASGAFFDASEAIRYLPLGLMWSDNGSGGSWGPVGPPGITSFSPMKLILTERSPMRRM